MRIKGFIQRHRVFVAVVAFVLSAAAGAVAAWLVSNVPGDGGAKVATLTAPNLQVVAATDIEDALLPGQSGALTLKVNNPNSVSLTLVSVASNGSPISSDPAACASANLTTPGLTASGLAISIPPGATTVVKVPGNIVRLDANAPTGCQGKSFRVPVLANFST